MVVTIQNLNESPKTYPIVSKTEWVQAAALRALGVVPETLTGSVSLTRTGRRVMAEGEVSLSFSGQCVRCAESIEVSYTFSFEHAFDREQDHGDGELELEESELNVGWYTGEDLDLSDVLSEVIALIVDIHYQCADQAMCDTRTAKMLADVASDDTGHPAFKILLDL